MNKIMTVVTLILLAGASLVHAQGAGLEWEILNQESIELHRQGCCLLIGGCDGI